MRTARFILCAAVLLPLALAVGQACGGQLTVGYDDAGEYHTAEGGILRPGSACVGWDASHYFDEGGTSCDLGSDECTALFAPPGWPYTQTCVAFPIDDDAGNPVVDDSGSPLKSGSGICQVGTYIPSLLPTCDPKDPKSDQFCTAYWEQFVTHGHVPGKCVGSQCYVDESPLGCTQTGTTRIEDDGAVSCSLPCAP